MLCTCTHCFILINWGCLTNPTIFFCCNEPTWLTHCKKKKLKLWRLPKIEDSTESWSALSLWPTYIGEKGRTLDKTYGIKVRHYWEHPWRTHREHIGNLMGTHWELEGNMMGTKEKCWAFPLAAWINFYFQNCLLPFWTCANTSIINWGYLLKIVYTWVVKLLASLHKSSSL